MSEKLTQAVIKILESSEIGSQQQLLKELETRGHTATQPTISRILNRLGATKTMGSKGQSCYRVSKPQIFHRQPITQLVVSMADNGFVIVIETHSGCAGALAQWIDENEFDGILGTIAGDNTIMVIPKDVSRIDLLYQEFAQCGLERPTEKD